jgi:hypothetical protein
MGLRVTVVEGAQGIDEARQEGTMKVLEIRHVTQNLTVSQYAPCATQGALPALTTDAGALRRL